MDRDIGLDGDEMEILERLGWRWVSTRLGWVGMGIRERPGMG